MTILIEKNAPVFTVIIDRPEVKNAIDGPTAQALADAFREFEEDDAFLVAVLCGANGTFCAGGDLKAGASLDIDRLNRFDPEGDSPLGPCRMILSKPVIAAVSGYAVAGGLELAIWCDMRIVEETAVFGVFCRRFGVPLIDGGTVRLPRLIGMSHAMDMILTGRPVEAEEAMVMGLANRLVPQGKSREVAEEIALQISQFPQTCMRNDRMSAYEQYDKSFEDAMTNEFEHGMAAVEKGETLQGAESFAKGNGRHGKFE